MRADMNKKKPNQCKSCLRLHQCRITPTMPCPDYKAGIPHGENLLYRECIGDELSEWKHGQVIAKDGSFTISGADGLDMKKPVFHATLIECENPDYKIEIVR